MMFYLRAQIRYHREEHVCEPGFPAYGRKENESRKMVLEVGVEPTCPVKGAGF
jgi:hypothetical protein